MPPFCLRTFRQKNPKGGISLRLVPIPPLGGLRWRVPARGRDWAADAGPITGGPGHTRPRGHGHGHGRRRTTAEPRNRDRLGVCGGPDGGGPRPQTRTTRDTLAGRWPRGIAGRTLAAFPFDSVSCVSVQVWPQLRPMKRPAVPGTVPARPAPNRIEQCHSVRHSFPPPQLPPVPNRPPQLPLYLASRPPPAVPSSAATSAPMPNGPRPPLK